MRVLVVRKIIYTFVTLSAILLTGCILTLNNHGEPPNNSANSANGGFFFGYKGNVYFNNFPEKGIFVFDREPKEMKKVVNGHFNGVVVDDSWIYTRVTSGEERGIYRLRINGSGLQKLTDIPGLYLCKSGDWLYYSRMASSGVSDRGIRTDQKENQRDNKNRRETGIYKLHVDTKEEIKITGDSARYIAVDKDWVYYLNYSDESKIYKVRVDGTEKQKITDETAYFMVMEGDWIYYFGDGMNRVKKDGSMKEVIKENFDGIHRFINVKDGWVYASARYVPDGWKLYKIDAKTRKEITLYEGYASNIHIIEDYIYFIGDGSFHRIKIDGSNYSQF